MCKKNLLHWLLVLASSITLTFPSITLAQGTLQGAWLLQQIQGPEGNVDAEPLPGLFLFTENHYSIMFATGTKPRALFQSENQTDAELVEAYRTFTANSGRFEVNGNEMIIHPYVARAPNFMSDFPNITQTYPYSRNGDSLTITFPNGAIFSFTNVDNLPPPWE